MQKKNEYLHQYHTLNRPSSLEQERVEDERIKRTIQEREKLETERALRDKNKKTKVFYNNVCSKLKK